jgi:hypothetical protein
MCVTHSEIVVRRKKLNVGVPIRTGGIAALRLKTDLTAGPSTPHNNGESSATVNDYFQPLDKSKLLEATIAFWYAVHECSQLLARLCDL